MNRTRKAKAVATRADDDACYRPSFLAALLALALAIFLAWHGMARADDFAANPPKAAQLPDAAQGPGADRIPPGLACSDDMDFSPEDNLPDARDIDSVGFHPGPHRLAHPVASGDRCRNDKRDKPKDA
jgi:hypothetical protein